MYNLDRYQPYITTTLKWNKTWQENKLVFRHVQNYNETKYRINNGIVPVGNNTEIVLIQNCSPSDGE